MKKQLLLLFTTLSISFFFSSCEKDLQEETRSSTNNPASALLQGVTQKTTSLDELKNDPYLSLIFNKALKNIKTNKEIYKRSNRETTYGLNLADEVKKYTLDQNEYTSYTIPILNNPEDSYAFQNLVIEKDVLRDAAYLITYFPDDNYKESVRKGLVHRNDNIDFTGSKLIQYLYYKRKVNVVNNTAQSRTGEAGVPLENDDIEPNITVCVQTYIPRNCTAGPSHTPHEIDKCKAAPSQKPYWDVAISCIIIPTLVPPTVPGEPACLNCVTSAVGNGNGGGGGMYFANNGQSPKEPQYICVATNPATGACNSVIPYTPIITDAMDPYNYYVGLLSRQQIIALLGVQYVEARKSIDAYLDANRTPTGGNTPEVKEFVNWIFDYFTKHPDTTFEQFKNWFLAPNEGKDGEYDADFWEDPNLTFPQQDLPTRAAYVAGIPKFENGTLMTGADNVYGLAGGKVLQARLDDKSDLKSVTANTCALKVSIALNRSGVVIPNIPGQTLEGGGTEFTGKYFFLNAKKLNVWMRETFGTNPATATTPYNANHISLTAADGGVKGVNFPTLPELQNVSGIYSIVFTNNLSSGHADYIYTNTAGQVTCATSCYFNLQIERMDIWKLD